MEKFNDDYVHRLYRPFRNLLRQYELFDSLRVIWAYSRNFTFKIRFPNDIELPTNFQQEGDINRRRYYGLLDHEQEFLAKEILINCSTLPQNRSLRSLTNLSKITNYLRHELQDGIDKKYNENRDILLEFNRLAHQQFKWQFSFNQSEIFRHYKIYSTNNISHLITKKYGITPFELYLTGFFLFRWVSENFRTQLPFKSSAKLIRSEMLDNFIKLFSMNISESRKVLKEYQQMNDKLLYSYNPLIAKPLLIYDNTLLCPLPLLIFWQITNGTYYSLINNPDFDNEFGKAFETYIGEVLEKTSLSSKFTIHPETNYGKNNHEKTSDWILEDEKGLLFIECKTKRMTMVSKTDADLKAGLENDLSKMGDFIVQVYKTYIDYTEDKYAHLKFTKYKKFVPIVVTLEDWFVNYNPKLIEIVNNNVKEKFVKENIDLSFLETNPFHIRSSRDFENDLQLINELGITSYFEKVQKNEIYDFSKSFKYKEIFENEFKKTFITPLKENHL